MERKFCGLAGVDSGQIAVVDPCYVLGDAAYEAACLGAATSKEHIFSPPYGSGVVLSSGGDGGYPVYAYFDSDRPGILRRIIIELDDDDDNQRRKAMDQERLQRLRRDLHESGDEYLVDVNKTLTDDQLSRLAELMKDGDA